jgi:hypothetical protein
MKARRQTSMRNEINVRKTLPKGIPYELVVYHSYVLTNNFKLNFPVLDPDTIIHLNHYFAEAGLFYPWHCKQIIDYCRENKRGYIKKECKRLFPDMFSWGSGPTPMAIPESLQGWNLMELSTLERESRNFKPKYEELTMTDMNAETSVSQEQTSSPSTNEFQDHVTLENYRKITGRRFRLTKAESQLVKDGQATRESIFQKRLESGQLEL